MTEFDLFLKRFIFDLLLAFYQPKKAYYQFYYKMYIIDIIDIAMRNFSKLNNLMVVSKILMDKHKKYYSYL